MTGDQSDFVSRLKRLFPRGWSGSSTPIFDAVWNGIASALAWSYGQIQYLKSQTRILSANDFWLDLISLDYFGNGLPRRDGEGDDAYRSRIEQYLLLPRGTRAAVSHAVELLTGQAPLIVEPWNTGDCGALDDGSLGWDSTGYWGDLDLQFQLFITAYRPYGEGVAYASGWDDCSAGLDISPFEWVDDSLIAGQVLDSDIYDVIANTMPAGTIAWTNIVDSPSVLSE